MEEYVEIEPEFIQLGPVTKEDIEKNFVECSLTYENDVTLTGMEVLKMMGISDDLVAASREPELELILNETKNIMKLTDPDLLLTWSEGRLAINSAKTNIRMHNILDALKGLCTIVSVEIASEAIANLLYKKIKELF